MHVFTLNLPEELRKKIDLIASRERRSSGQQIVFFLEKYFEEHPENPDEPKIDEAEYKTIP